MAKYRECENCGAALDPGEACDCTKEAEVTLGAPTAKKANEAAIKAAMDADVCIELRKEAGSETFHRTITASSASAALNGIAILIQEYAKLTGLPVMRVLAVLAATMTAPALKEE